jgi:hypothetical protein
VTHTPAKWLREIATIPADPTLAAHTLSLGLRHLSATMKLIHTPEYTRMRDRLNEARKALSAPRTRVKLPLE